MAAVMFGDKIFVIVKDENDNTLTHNISLPSDTLVWDFCSSQDEIYITIATIDKITFNDKLVVKNDNTGIISIITDDYGVFACVFNDRIEILRNEQKWIYEFEFTEHLRNYKYFCETNFKSLYPDVIFKLKMFDYVYVFMNGNIEKTIKKPKVFKTYYLSDDKHSNSMECVIDCVKVKYNHHILRMGNLYRFIHRSDIINFDISLVNNFISHKIFIYDNDYYVFIDWFGFVKLEPGYVPYILTKPATSTKSARN